MDQQRGLFLSLVGVLLGFGVLMVHSASITSHPTDFEQVYLSRHVTFLALGLCVAAVAAVVPPHTWFRLAPYLFVITVCLLVLLLVPGLARRVHGAQRWLRIGPFSMQPSELAKFTLPVYLGWMSVRLRWNTHARWAGFLLPSVSILLVVFLVIKQPDLGTAMFLGIGSGILLWVAGWPLRNFFCGALLTLPAIVMMVLQQPYQVRRITGYLAAWSDMSQAPYQLKQSLMTLGSGGSWGVGLAKGWQKLSFLPEANTDFVFAVIGEELGLVGTLAVVFLWGGVYILGLRLLSHLDHRGFAYLTGVTLLTQLVLQAAINVAVVTAVVPPKGISHPLISYGGSNLVTSLLSLGVILSLSRPQLQSWSGSTAGG